VEAQLFAQEEVLGGQGGSGLEKAAQEPNEVYKELAKGDEGER